MIYKAKKSLGQNFLKSKLALKKICTISNLTAKDIVLEIGPGKGVLTSELLQRAKRVVAVEKDNDLIIYLREKFTKEINLGNLILVNQDILDFNLNDFKKYKLLNKKYKIIANIPYNITGLILKKFLSSSVQPSTMTLLVQKEVAKRILGITDILKSNLKKSGKESILSLSVKAYGEPSYIMKVEKRFFSPSPKVDSAIILIKNISRNNFKSKKEEETFFKIIKTGFAHKRKLLKKNLESIEEKTEQINQIFEELEIGPKIRAESVSFNIWIKIMQSFLKNKNRA